MQGCPLALSIMQINVQAIREYSQFQNKALQICTKEFLEYISVIPRLKHDQQVI